MTSYSVGQKIELNDGRTARIRFAGTTEFQTGDWIGVELEEPTGKNDGAVKGMRYFECDQGYGMFVRPAGVRAVLEDVPKPQRQVSNGSRPADSVKSRPSSVHTAVNGVKKTDALGRRTSLVAASPTPGARSTGLGGIRSPAKSPTKQLGTNGSIRNSILRTATPPTAARKPAVPTTTARSRPSISSAAATSKASAVRTSRTSLAPAAVQRAAITNGARTTAERQTLSNPLQRRTTDDQKPQTVVEEEAEEVQDSPSEADTQGDADDYAPRNFAPPAALPPQPPPVPPDTGAKTTARRGSSPAPSMLSQRTVRGTAVSSRHVEELEAKIRLLERKRLEDRDVKKALDQAQQDRDKYQGIIEKLQRKYQPQQQEIVDLKKALTNADSRNATVDALQAEHESMMEMATVDKEMAEETAEALKAELDTLRARQEEMELELEVLRDENEEFSKDMSPEERNSAGWLQLQNENDRLRNALLRLRDLTRDREEELKSDLAEVQTQVKDFEQIRSHFEATKVELLTSQSNADDLRQQLEAALGAEEIIETLTERNMILTERIDELKITIDDLEDLRELNDELEVNHIEAEKQMQDEIDFKDALVLDRDRIAKQQQAALDDADYTINRFRELVTQLQTDFQDMQASKEISETEAADLESKSRAMIDLNMRLQTSASKTQVKTVDLELRKMEAQEASEHLGIVQLFLPDAFSGERDSVLALLRFRRIKFKAALLQNFVRERMSTTSRVQDHNVFAAADVLTCLTWIVGMSDRFINAIYIASIEDFAKYESAQYELEPVERALNTYIDALRQDEVKEEGMADELQRSIAVMSHLASIHIGDELANHGNDLIAQIVVLQSQLEGIASAFTAMKALIEVNLNTTEPDDESEEGDSDSGFIIARADSLAGQARGIKVVLGKTHRALSELQERSLTLQPACGEDFSTVESVSRAILQYTRRVGDSLLGLFNEEGRDEPITSDEVAAIIMRAASAAFDLPAPEAGPFTAVLHQLRSLSDLATELAALPNDLDNTVEFERAAAPWLARAEQLRQHKLSAQDTEAELARTKENLRERDVNLRTKETELEEQSVRIEMLEARMREASKRSARIAELERVVHDAKDNERRAKQDLDKSKRDATQELDRVREELNRSVRRGQRGATITSVDDGVMGAGAQLAMKRQEHQITTLQAAVRYLKDENTRLRLPAPTAPKAVSQSIAWLYEPLIKPKRDREQQQVALQKTGRDLLKSLQEIALTAKNINLKTLPENKLAWRPAKQTSRWQLEKRKEEWATWQGWREDFIDDVHALRLQVR